MWMGYKKGPYIRAPSVGRLLNLFQFFLGLFLLLGLGFALLAGLFFLFLLLLLSAALQIVLVLGYLSLEALKLFGTGFPAITGLIITLILFEAAEDDAQPLGFHTQLAGDVLGPEGLRLFRLGLLDRHFFHIRFRLLVRHHISLWGQISSLTLA